MSKKLIGMILVVLLLALMSLMIIEIVKISRREVSEVPDKTFIFRASGQDRVIEKQFDLLQTTTENTYTLRNADSTLIAIYRLTPAYSIEIIPLKKNIR